MKYVNLMEEMFGGDPVPFRHVYETAQIVVHDYMKKNNKKISFVADMLNTTEKYLRHMLDPNQTHRPLSVDRVIEITALTGDTRIIDAMKLASKPREGESCSIHDVMISTLDVQTHTGELSRTLTDAIADGEIDDNEKERLHRVVASELKALYDVLDKLK